METRKKNKKEQEILDELIAHACEDSNFHAMEFLLEQGADADAKASYVKYICGVHSGGRFLNGGGSLLHQAASTNQFPICKLLIAHGANVNNQRDNGWTVLHDFALSAHNFDCPHNPKQATDTFKIHSVFSLLHDNGADLNAKNYFGMTPLHCAALWGNLHFCILAARRWAKTDVEDRHGKTPLDYAKEMKEEKIVQFLEKQLIWQP